MRQHVRFIFSLSKTLYVISIFKLFYKKNDSNLYLSKNEKRRNKLPKILSNFPISTKQVLMLKLVLRVVESSLIFDYCPRVPRRIQVHLSWCITLLTCKNAWFSSVGYDHILFGDHFFGFTDRVLKKGSSNGETWWQHLRWGPASRVRGIRFKQGSNHWFRLQSQGSAVWQLQPQRIQRWNYEKKSPSP